MRRRLYPLVLLALALLLGGCDQGPRLSPLPADAVILAFGDSLTHGTGASSGASYPAQLAAITGRQVVNAGKPGELSAAGMARLPALLERHRPDLLLLCHGGNDLLRKKDPAALQENLSAMVKAAQARGIPVLLIAVPRPTLLLSTEPLYEAVAESLGVAYEGDALADILGDNRLKSDPIHPNAEGYRRLAEAVATRLGELGAL